MAIFFLTLSEVLALHKDEIQRYGGASGVRNKELLISALAQPSASFSGQYLHKDLFKWDQLISITYAKIIPLSMEINAQHLLLL